MSSSLENVLILVVECRFWYPIFCKNTHTHTHSHPCTHFFSTFLVSLFLSLHLTKCVCPSLSLQPLALREHATSTPPFLPYSVTSLPSSAVIFRWVSTDGRHMSPGLPAGLISAGSAGKLWQIDVRACCRCSRFCNDRLHLKDLGRVPTNEFYKNRLANIDQIGWRELIFFVTIESYGRYLKW